MYNGAKKMNKQQMKEIIYEEFVNNIYENSKFNLSEDQNKMVEELMGQIFKEAPMSDEEEKEFHQKQRSQRKAAGTTAPGAEETPPPTDMRPTDDESLSEEEIAQLSSTFQAAHDALDAMNDEDLTPEDRAEKAKRKKEISDGEAAVKANKKGTSTPETDALIGKGAQAAKKVRAKSGGEGAKEKKYSTDNIKAQTQAKQAQQQAVYVIQQADPQNFRQYMKRHGIVGGILKKGFEVLFGTGIWDNPADARYVIQHIYKNPYDAPQIMVQTLQKYRTQLAALPPATQQVVAQVVDAAKDEDTKMQNDPGQAEAEATEKDRTDVDDVLSGDGEEKPEEAPGEETEEPGEEKPEEGKAQVPKDDIDWGGVEGNKQRSSNWESKNLVDEPPGDKRVMLAQQTLLPDLIYNALAKVRRNENITQKNNLISEFESGPSVADQDRVDFDDANSLKRSLGIKGDLAKALNNAKLNSINRDGLFSSVFELMLDKPKALQKVYLNTSPEVFARAMVPLLDTTVNKFIKVLGSQHGSVFSQFLEKEKSANSGDQAPPSDSSRPETSSDVRRRKRDRPQARRIRGEGMQAYMENKKSEKLTSPKVGHGILAWALEKVSKRMKKKKERAAQRMTINKENLTPENITKAVTEWHANKGITLQEGKAKKVAESILKVVK